MPATFETVVASSAWSSGAVGQIVGVGPGRGIGLLFMISGLTLVIVSLIAWTSPRIRHLERELPDMLSGEAEAAEADEVVDTAVTPQPV